MSLPTAQAMVLEQFGAPLALRELPVPELPPGGVLLRLRASGICGSDLDITTGEDPRVTLPLVPGHEGIGEIAALHGQKADVFGEWLQVGDLVAFNRGLTCGQCPYCTLRGQPELCPWRETYGINGGPPPTPPRRRGGENGDGLGPSISGCYAEMILLQARTELIKLPPEAEPVWLVPATCSGATAAHAVELSGTRPADVVVVIGPGPLGLYAAALAFASGADQVVMVGSGRGQGRLELAETMGCVPVSAADTGPEDRLELVRGLTHGLGAAAVLDCAGTAATIGEAIGLVAPGGTVTIPGLATPLPDFAFDPYALARKQIRLQGVWTSNVRHLHQALTVAHSGRYPLDAMVTHVLPLAQANEGLGLLRAKQAIKVVLTPT